MRWPLILATMMAALQKRLANGGNALWLGAMALVVFSLLLPFAAYVAALPLIREEWGLSNTGAGAIYSANLAGYAVAALLVLPLTDRIGPKRVLLASAVVSVGAHVLFPLLASDVYSASALRALDGFGLVGVYMPAVRIVAERFPGTGRGLAVGLMVTAFYAANSASIAATGALLTLMSWRAAYLTVALIAAGAIPVAWAALRGYEHKPSAATGRLNLSVLRLPRVRPLIAGYSLHSMELFAAQVWIPSFFAATLLARGRDVESAAVTAAAAAGIAFGVGSLGPVMGGAISDRLGRVPAAALIFGLGGAFAAGIGWMGGAPWGLLVFVAVVYSWLIAADSAVYTTAITEAVPTAMLGSALALQAFIGIAAGAASPVLFGGILDLVPDRSEWGVGFSVVAGLAGIAVATLVRAERARRAAPGRR